MNLLDQSDMKSALAASSVYVIACLCLIVPLVLAVSLWPNSVGTIFLVVLGIAAIAWLVWLILYLLKNWDDVWL